MIFYTFLIYIFGKINFVFLISIRWILTWVDFDRVDFDSGWFWSGGFWVGWILIGLILIGWILIGWILNAGGFWTCPRYTLRSEHLLHRNKSRQVFRRPLLNRETSLKVYHTLQSRQPFVNLTKKNYSVMPFLFIQANANKAFMVI